MVLLHLSCRTPRGGTVMVTSHLRVSTLASQYRCEKSMADCGNMIERSINKSAQ
jgi:hypothetical protein